MKMTCLAIIKGMRLYLPLLLILLPFLFLFLNFFLFKGNFIKLGKND